MLSINNKNITFLPYVLITKNIKTFFSYTKITVNEVLWNPNINQLNYYNIRIDI